MRKQAWDQCWREANQIVACQRKEFANRYAETGVWSFYWKAVFWSSVAPGILGLAINFAQESVPTENVVNSYVFLFFVNLVVFFPIAWFYDRTRKSLQADKVYDEFVM